MLEDLFQPCAIGQTEVPNRIVMPPMVSFLANESGAVTQRMIDYYAARAKGGAGLIMVEAAYVQEKDRDFGRLGIENPRLLPGLNELAESIQEHGAKAFVQLNHRGSVLAIHKGKGPDELSREEIEAIIDAFSTAACHAQKAGFDGAEIHGANVYLISQFLSPLTNHRRDEYGGNQEGRIKLAKDILRRVRQRVSKEFTVTFRMNGSELTEGGITLDDAQFIARQMEETGADAVHVAACSPRAPYWYIPPMAIPRGCHVPLAQGIKKVVNIPVIAVGRINDPVLANEIVATGKADLVAMGRALIADPDLPRKAREGKFEAIRKCIACNFCRQRISLCRTRRCTVNAQAGQERDHRITPAAIPRKVMVVGGGPAGMEAARVLALRGHRVALYEKGGQLGGQVNLALIPPLKEELRNILDYLIHQIKTSDILVHLNHEVTRETANEDNPEVIVLAAGALPILPEIAGLTPEMVFSPEEALLEKRSLGEKILVIGGGMVGCEVAEFLAGKGKKVTILEVLPEVAATVEDYTRRLLLERLEKLAVKILTASKALRFQGDRIVIDSAAETIDLETDSVIAAMGSRANRSCAELASCGRPFYTIGDAVKSRDITAAIHEGFHVATQI